MYKRSAYLYTMPKTANNGPKAAPRRGPSHVLRFRNQREKWDVRRAAKDKGLSVNTYILTEVLAQARNYLSYRG
jgi:hypothetical protein